MTRENYAFVGTSSPEIYKKLKQLGFEEIYTGDPDYWFFINNKYIPVEIEFEQIEDIFYTNRYFAVQN